MLEGGEGEKWAECRRGEGRGERERGSRRRVGKSEGGKKCECEEFHSDSKQGTSLVFQVLSPVTEVYQVLSPETEVRGRFRNMLGSLSNDKLKMSTSRFNQEASRLSPGNITVVPQ